MATLESRISVPEDVLFRDLDGEAVVLNLTSGKYYGLDETGTRMWTLLAQHGRIDAAFKDLLDEYEVTEEQLRQDLLNLVDELAVHGLLELHEA
jgi:hypothetical protein